MNKKNFFVAAVTVWLVCVGSLVGIHSYMHKRPRPSASMVEAHAIFQGLDNEEKTNIAHHESTILRLNDESFHLVGLGHESEENELIADNKISLRKIEFHIDDPVLIERQLMVNEAFRNLNNAEKKCLEDGFAAIVFRKGYYCLIFDSVRYPEYVSKYGTECKSCDERQNEKQVKKEVS